MVTLFIEDANLGLWKTKEYLRRVLILKENSMLLTYMDEFLMFGEPAAAKLFLTDLYTHYEMKTLAVNAKCDLLGTQMIGRGRQHFMLHERNYLRSLCDRFPFITKFRLHFRYQWIHIVLPFNVLCLRLKNSRSIIANLWVAFFIYIY